MISRIKIKFDEPIEEVKAILSQTVVMPSNNMMGIKGRFKNLENIEKFYFKYDADPLLVGIGICKLKTSKNSNKTEIVLTILPPILWLILAALALLGCVYAISSFGMANYGTLGFWPSIIIPSGCLSVLLLFWSFIGWFAGKRLKKNILSGIHIAKNEIESKK